MIIPKILASKIEEHGAQQILKLIRAWERRKARDKQRYAQRKELLSKVKAG